MFRVVKILSLLTVLFVSAAHAQLAITEVMTSEQSGKYPDWWELKNFGTNAINLTGYHWEDGDPTHSAQAADAPFTGVIIPAGGIILLTETNSSVLTSNAFQTWWNNSISSSVQIVVTLSTHGLSGSSGDGVRLWNANVVNSTDPADQADLVDRIDVGPATKGVSFNYDSNNGTFDLLSVSGVNGAITSTAKGDIGSPGVGPASSPIVLTQQPSNTVITVGVPFVFNIGGYGLPKPKFTWLSNGVPVDPAIFTVTPLITNNASFSTLSLTNAQTNYNGTYTVLSYNGVQTRTNTFTLTVNPLPSAPVFTSFSPTNLWAYINQTVTFSAAAYGNPTPTYEWYFNGVDTGTSGPQLMVSLSDTNQSGTYSVVASNSVSTNVMSGNLIVTPKPDLEITEVMSSEQTNNLNGSTTNDSDWWELSNFGSFPVNLQGCRFDDSHDLLSDSVTITNAVTIAPGESIIFVNDMTPAQFQTWWGTANLPANLQIIDYPRIGFAAAGDSLYFWNAAAAFESDYIDAESFAAATRGVSFTYNPDDDAFDGTLSQSGVNGAITAPIGGDIGSPGYVSTGAVTPPPNPPVITSAGSGSGGFALTWTTQPNDNYAVSYKVNLTDTNWTILVVLSASGSSLSYTDTAATNTSRYYRILAANP